jgi:uncharacterized membrane protein
MSTCKSWSSLILCSFLGMFFLFCQPVIAADNVILYTPNTKITVAPGAVIDYIIDVINYSSELQRVDLSVTGLPKKWNYILKSGEWNISQLSILPGERKNLSLRIEVPLQVNKGSYLFKVIAGELYSLPLVVTVSEQGTYKTEFTSKQPNMEGHANSTYSFNAELKNRTANKQLYALMADPPRGWTVTFKASLKQVTSVEIEANSTAGLTIEVNPPAEVDAGKYTIPLSAATNETSANLEVEVVITGTYKIELTTPFGLLSNDITAGDEKKIDLLIKNSGSSELNNIKLIYAAPSKWEVSFDPKNVIQLGPGSSTHVYATIKADKKSIPGDYATEITAKTPEAVSKASFRFTVKTPMLWGWVGILIIIIALGSVYYLFRKYGRR